MREELVDPKPLHAAYDRPTSRSTASRHSLDWRRSTRGPAWSSNQVSLRVGLLLGKSALVWGLNHTR